MQMRSSITGLLTTQPSDDNDHDSSAAGPVMMSTASGETKFVGSPKNGKKATKSPLSDGWASGAGPRQEALVEVPSLWPTMFRRLSPRVL